MAEPSPPARGRVRRHHLVALALLGALALGAKRHHEDEVPAIVAAAQAQAATDRAAAITSLEQYLSASPDPEVEPWAQLWAGEERRLAGDLGVARGWFEAVAVQHPTHELKDAAVLGMALVDAEHSLSGNTLATIQLQDPEVAPDTMRADRLRVLARASASEGTTTKRTREMAAQAMALAQGDPQVQARIQMVLADLLVTEAGGSAPVLDAQGQALSPQAQALVQARRAMARHAFDEVLSQADSAQAAWPDSPEAAQLQWLAKRARAKDPTVAGRVGVLLPLSGEYAPPAQRLKDAISLANAQAGSPLDLVFVDTKADATTAVQLTQQLVLEKGCVALMGPLHKDAVAAASPVAQGLGVPMITLTQSGDPTVAGDYVFGGLVSLEQQVDALVDHAMGTMGKRSFTVMHPRNAYGDSARDLFVAAVTKRGGTVVRVIPYDPEAKDYRNDARLLGQKKGARPDKGEPDPPTVDFDAIFLPDNFRRATLVASALAYEEFPVGAFRPRFGGDGVALLGLNGWNTDSIVSEGGDYMTGAILVDAFLPSQGSAAVQSFDSAYTSAYDRDPVMLDAVVFDDARIVAAAVQAGGEDRDEIRDQLSKVQLIGPVTGARGFGADREVDRTLLVLRVGTEHIEEWKPPEDEVAPSP